MLLLQARYAPIPKRTSGDEIQLASKSPCNISCSNNKHYCAYITRSHQQNGTIIRKQLDMWNKQTHKQQTCTWSSTSNAIYDTSYKGNHVDTKPTFTAYSFSVNPFRRAGAGPAITRLASWQWYRRPRT